MAAGNKEDGANDRLILIFLGMAALICIAGIVMLAVLNVDAQPLVAIASAAVGAMATKITGRDFRSDRDSDDDFAILGRAATKSIITEAMRQMGANAIGGDE